jgi:hypothetical protein
LPIRTNRGRAAVYRRLWGWPLRSPKHLVVVVLFLLAIVLFAGYILPRVTGGSQASQSSSSSSSTARTTTPSQTPTQGAPGVLPPEPPAGAQPVSPTTTRQTPSTNKTPAKADPKALDVAAKWAEAFVKHDGVATDQWLNGLRPFTTDEYLATTLSTIDPRTIVAKKVTGSPTSTADSYTSSVTVQVPTDAKKLSITLIKTTDGWRVDQHDEVI